MDIREWLSRLKKKIGWTWRIPWYDPWPPQLLTKSGYLGYPSCVSIYTIIDDDTLTVTSLSLFCQYLIILRVTREWCTVRHEILKWVLFSKLEVSLFLCLRISQFIPQCLFVVNSKVESDRLVSDVRTDDIIQKGKCGVWKSHVYRQYIYIKRLSPFSWWHPCNVGSITLMKRFLTLTHSFLSTDLQNWLWGVKVVQTPSDEDTLGCCWY